MKCPNCNKKLAIPRHAYMNAETYGPNKVNTLCCGVTVWVRPRISFDIELYQGNEDTDDWGAPVYKGEKPR